ncbi:MAG: outer membrane lipoprotein LolB, partial [Pseudomonadota bacterium]|nr:outer membrane lipoprotein LolB [Pseudomonadota bacterium]
MGFSERGARLAAIASVLVTCGCASLSSTDVRQIRFADPRAAYEVTGRLSARHDADAFTATFHWSHSGDRDELDLASPLGQTVARLTGDARGVELRTPDGRVERASDWST